MTLSEVRVQAADDDQQFTGLRWAAEGLSSLGRSAQLLGDVLASVFWRIPFNFIGGLFMVAVGLFLAALEALLRAILAILLGLFHGLISTISALIYFVRHSIGFAHTLSKKPAPLVVSGVLMAAALASWKWIESGGDPSTVITEQAALYGAAGVFVAATAVAFLLLIQFVIRTALNGLKLLAQSLWNGLRFLWRALPGFLRSTIFAALRILAILVAVAWVAIAAVGYFVWIPPWARVPLPVAIAIGGAILAVHVLLLVLPIAYGLVRIAVDACADIISQMLAFAASAVRQLGQLILEAARSTLSFVVSVRRTDSGCNLSLFSVEILSRSRNTITLFAVSFLSFSVKSLEIFSVSVLFCVSLFSTSYLTVEVVVPWLRGFGTPPAAPIVAGPPTPVSVSDAGQILVPESAPAEQDGADAEDAAIPFSQEELAAALQPLTEERAAAWAFDRADLFRLVDAGAPLPTRVSDLLNRDLCTLGLVIAYGSASSDGPRDYNEALADRRAYYLSSLVTQEAKLCPDVEQPTVLAATLGQSLSELPDQDQRTVQIAGLERSALARVSDATLASPRRLLAMAAERSSLPSPDEFSAFRLCTYSTSGEPRLEFQACEPPL